MAASTSETTRPTTGRYTTMRDSTPQQLTMPEGMPVGYSLPIPVDALAIVTPVEERYDGTLVPVVKRAGV